MVRESKHRVCVLGVDHRTRETAGPPAKLLLFANGDHFGGAVAVNDVVEDVDADKFSGAGESFGDLNVFPTRRGIA